MDPYDWQHWMTWNPPPLLIQIFREGWQRPVTCFPSEIHPEMNANGLYWRLTGIAKQVIEVA